MKKMLIVLGLTSTGKTDLALILAKRFNGELISCDSRQVYKDLDVGTGKLPGGRWKVEDGKWKKGKGFWDIEGIKVWMYDVADPKKQYTVYHYVEDANKVINEILKRGKLPIIVGGTGLYLKALLEGLPNLIIPPNLRLREKLEKLSLQQMQKRLQKLSSQKWEQMNNSDRQNPRRLVRAIEIASFSSTSEESLRATIRGDLQTLKIGLTAPREILYKRIDERVIRRINQGMIEEAERLHNRGLGFKRMRQLGLEYGVLADYLTGRIKSEEEFIKVLQGKIHSFARRQTTWFKKGKDIEWFDITTSVWLRQVESSVNSWYYETDEPPY